jgi:hypothetical protein
MPASLEFLRGVLGIIGLACAYMAGRSLAVVRRGWQRQRSARPYAWIIRATVCLAAIVFRYPVDAIAITLWGLSIVAFGVAYWQILHQKPQEDLSHDIFPHES